MRLPISRFIVNGNSMSPTLKSGQNILSFNWAYLGIKPKKGDLVVIKQDGKEMVKRIEKVEDGKVFVVGDNLRESTDSRHFGLINLDQIIGKVIFSSENHPECNEGSLNLFQISLTFVRDVSPPKADQHDNKLSISIKPIIADISLIYS